jgi:hypothetical protein
MTKAPVGKAALAVRVKRDGASTVARLVGVDESTVRLWVKGKRSPRPAQRARLVAIGIPWTAREARTLALDAAPAAASNPPDASESVAHESSETELRASLTRLRLLEERADTQKWAPRDVIALATSRAAVVRELAKITGESNAISPRRIASSPAWKVIEDALLEALRKHPEARADVGAFLEAQFGKGLL